MTIKFELKLNLDLFFFFEKRKMFINILQVLNLGKRIVQGELGHELNVKTVTFRKKLIKYEYDFKN